MTSDAKSSETEALEDAIEQHRQALQRAQELYSAAKQAKEAYKLACDRYNKAKDKERKLKFIAADAEARLADFEVGGWYQREAPEWKNKELSDNPTEIVYIVSKRTPKKNTYLTVYHFASLYTIEWNSSVCEHQHTTHGWYTSHLELNQAKMRVRTSQWRKLSGNIRLGMVVKGGVSLERLKNVADSLYHKAKPPRYNAQLYGTDHIAKSNYTVGGPRWSEPLCDWRLVTASSEYTPEEATELFVKKGVWTPYWGTGAGGPTEWQSARPIFVNKPEGK